MLIEIRPEVYTDYQTMLARKAALSGKPYVPKPYVLFYCGSPLYADPVVEVPDHVGQVLIENRPTIVRPYTPPPTQEDAAFDAVVNTTEEIPVEMEAEDLVEMVGELTCRYCKHVFKNQRAKMIHEIRWCKKRPE